MRKQPKNQYGQFPKDLGRIDIDCKEIMFYQYMPVKMALQYAIQLEPRLQVFLPLIHAVQNDLGPGKWVENYIYLTAKRVYVNETYAGNRPGWHSDGFLTDDLNYIWTDAEPTVFSGGRFELTPDHEVSLTEMDEQAERYQTFVFPLKNLLRLDQYVIHRAPDNCCPGFRTFVKISVSKHRYNLIGNSHNYGLKYDWSMAERSEERNHPVK